MGEWRVVAWEKGHGIDIGVTNGETSYSGGTLSPGFSEDEFAEVIAKARATAQKKDEHETSMAAAIERIEAAGIAVTRGHWRRPLDTIEHEEVPPPVPPCQKIRKGH